MSEIKSGGTWELDVVSQRVIEQQRLSCRVTVGVLVKEKLLEVDEQQYWHPDRIEVGLVHRIMEANPGLLSMTNFAWPEFASTELVAVLKEWAASVYQKGV